MNLKRRNDMKCPFCNEDDFDDIGLKSHLLSGWCDVFEKLPSARQDIESHKSLTPNQVEQANAKVTAIIATARHVTYSNRDKIPEALLELCDAYCTLTGQEPRKKVITDWLDSLSQMHAAGVTGSDLTEARKAMSGIPVIPRPGSLLDMAIAVRAKRRAGITATINQPKAFQAIQEWERMTDGN
jgi:hypothetical protein